MRICAIFILSITCIIHLNSQRYDTKPKNILIIYSDDHSYHALGAAGNKQIKTPNLDKLVKQGMYFTQAHVMGGNQGAICTPSRAMMLTGRYVNNLPGDGAIIPDSVISMPEVLRSKGYTTFHSGKWHNDKASHHRMFSHGGNIFFGGMHFENEGGQFHPKVYSFNKDGNYASGELKKVDTFSSALYANDAIRFLNSDLAQSNPFMCYVAFTSPHDPRTPPADYINLYNPDKIKLPGNFLPQHPFDIGTLSIRDELLLPKPLSIDAIKKEIALYYAMVSEMDFQVGRILNALDKNGLRQNTLIVFAGDNGLAVGQHGLLGKQNLYEHSIRVPLIFSGPGVPRGKRYEGYMYLSDISPTILSYLSIDKPISMEALSYSIVFNQPKMRIRPSIYNLYSSYMRSLKSDDHYKLILYHINKKKTVQLFNLNSDPWEVKNLATLPKYAPKIGELKRELQSRMESSHDPLSIEEF